MYKAFQIFLVLFHQCILQVKIRLKCHVHVTFSYFIKRLQQKYGKQYKLCKYLHFHFKMSSTFMKLLNCNYSQQRTRMAFTSKKRNNIHSFYVHILLLSVKYKRCLKEKKHLDHSLLITIYINYNSVYYLIIQFNFH